MYADDAATECICDGVTIIGKARLRAYWQRRLYDCRRRTWSILGLSSSGGTTIFYIASAGVVDATLQFDIAAGSP